MANTPALSTAEVGEVFQSRTNQLAAVLSLLNTYVPGSYLLESQCLHFLGRDNYNGLSKRLFKTTPKHGRADKEVRIAHTQYCTELLAKAGVTRSDTTRTFLNNFCKDQISPWLFGFVKNMLTTRKMKKEVDRVNSRDIKKERFSRLILDIQMKEGNEQCATVLEEASNTFDQDPFFPQALARFYYIELEDYEQAEMWAAEALKRDPQNSFIADTLGQVHKNHLMNDEVSEPREILRLAQKAIKAFEEEEKLAEVEDGPGMKKQGNTINYYRGQFGYLQVCNTLYDKLVSKNETWKNVLTREESMTSVCTSLEGENLLEFSKLIENLRDEVEEKCIFLKQFLTYSRPNEDKDVRRPCHHDPKYISDDTSECYQKYVGDTTANQLIEMFKKRNLDDQSVEVLSFLVKQYTQSELIEIFTKCRESASADSETALVNNILTPFRRKMPPSDTDPRELHMFTLLWYWPENEGHCDYDLRELTQKMYNEIKYVKYFRNRYFLPVFFIGKGEGVKRIVHRNVIEKHLKVRPDRSNNWKNERIFRNPGVKELLLRLKGEVKNLRVYTRVGSKEIEIDTNVRNKNWKSPSVTFYLGFTIRGPVAFDIQNKTRQRVRKRNSETAVNSTCLL